MTTITVRKRNLHRAVDLERPHQDQGWASPVEVVVLLERVEARSSVEGPGMGVGLFDEGWPHGMNRQQNAPI